MQRARGLPFPSAMITDSSTAVFGAMSIAIFVEEAISITKLLRPAREVCSPDGTIFSQSYFSMNSLRGFCLWCLSQQLFRNERRKDFQLNLSIVPSVTEPWLLRHFLSSSLKLFWALSNIRRWRCSITLAFWIAFTKWLRRCHLGVTLPNSWNSSKRTVPIP